MANIRDVAKLAGVSSSTVSLTFSDSERVSGDTARKVWQAAEQLGYRPNPLAQSLKRGRSNLIGMIVGDLSNPFSGRFLKRVEQLAQRARYNVIVTESDALQQRELEILRDLSAQRIAGVLLFPHGQGQDYLEALHGMDIPLVTVDHKIDGGQFDNVRSDSHLAASMLTEHLVRLGHRRIAHISGPLQYWSAAERCRGYRETLQAAGIEHSQVLDGGYLAEPAYAQTMRLLTGVDRPTAILAANNVMALGSLQAMQELGIDCPGDVSLATIDDVPWNSVIKPSLTLVEQDIQRLATEATEFLLGRMQDPELADAPPRERVLVPKLVLGDSTQRVSKQQG